MAPEFNVGTTNIIDRSALNLFPNPTESTLHFNLELEEIAEVQVRVYDILGRVVLEKAYGADQTSLNAALNVSLLRSGTYIFEASTSLSSVYQKFSIY